MKRCKPHKTAHHPTEWDVINDVKLFPTVYRRIYCRKFLRYPVRRGITKASALEFFSSRKPEKNSRFHR